MKKTFSLVLLLVSSVNMLYSQPKIEKAYWPKDTYLEYYIPGRFCINGEPLLGLAGFYDGEAEENLSVVDMDGNSVLSMPVATYKSSYDVFFPAKDYDVSANIVSENLTLWQYHGRLYESHQQVDIDKLEKGPEGVQGAMKLLQEIDPYRYSSSGWIIFKDAKGRDAFYNEDSMVNFYEYEKYGKQFPKYYFAFNDDNLLYEVRCEDYEVTINVNSFEDAVEPEIRYYSALVPTYYTDLQTFGSVGPVVTQTLYNSDSNFEYWVDEYEEKTSEREDWYGNSYSTQYYGKIVSHKSVLKQTSLKNESGKEILVLPVEEMEGYTACESRINYWHDLNCDFILHQVYYEGFSDEYEEAGIITCYRFYPETQSVKAISRSEKRMTVDASGAGNDGDLNITVDGGRDDEKVVISDMGGRVVGRVPASANGARIKRTEIGTGIYNVTLQSKDGMENQKVQIP